MLQGALQESPVSLRTSVAYKVRHLHEVWCRVVSVPLKKVTYQLQESGTLVFRKVDVRYVSKFVEYCNRYESIDTLISLKHVTWHRACDRRTKEVYQKAVNLVLASKTNWSLRRSYVESYSEKDVDKSIQKYPAVVHPACTIPGSCASRGNPRVKCLDFDTGSHLATGS